MRTNDMVADVNKTVTFFVNQGHLMTHIHFFVFMGLFRYHGLQIYLHLFKILEASNRTAVLDINEKVIYTANFTFE